ncbi:hypothetical protein ABFS83_04G190100 [Erythranthe nasuta]
MAIGRNSVKLARFESEFHSPHSRDTPMSTDEDEDFQQQHRSASAVESDDDDEFNDCDSGAGSDDFDLLEFGETGEEFCQVGDLTRSIPYELYDLPGLKDVLSMEVWNEVLNEEERFGLSKYIPDMDQEHFVLTLKELFFGENLHFGTPVNKLFEMLKGGLCEPRVALYRQGLTFFQRRQHYHNLRKYHNGMLNSLCQIRDAWLNFKGYSIEEKLRVMNIMKSQKSLMNENMEEFGTEPSDREESGDGLWEKKPKDRNLGQKTGHYLGSDISSRGKKATMVSAKYGRRNPSGTLKLVGSKSTSMKELAEPFPVTQPGVKMKSGRYGLGLPVSQYKKESGYDPSAVVRMNEQILEDDDYEAETMAEVTVHRDRNFPRAGADSKLKKHEDSRPEEDIDGLMGMPMLARNNLHALGRNQAINKLSDIKVLTAKPSNAKSMHDGGRKVTYADNFKQFTSENDPALFSKHDGLFPFPSDLSSKPGDSKAKNKKWKMGRDAVALNANEKLLHTEYRAQSLQAKFQPNSLNGRRDGAGNRGVRTFDRSEETESDSSEQMEENENEDDNQLIRSKWSYGGGMPDMKQGELSKRDKKTSYLTLDEPSRSSRMMEDYNEPLEMMKSEQKGKMHEIGYFNVLPTKDVERSYFPGAIGTDHFNQLERNGYMEGNNDDNFHVSSLKSSLALGRRRKGEVPRDFGLPQSNYMPNHNIEDDLFWTRPLAADIGVPFKMGKKAQMVDVSTGHHAERSDVPLMGCNTLSKKRKVKDGSMYMDMREINDYLRADTNLELDDVGSARKRGKNKLGEASDVLENGVSQLPVVELEMEDVEAETKRQKKSFPLITPTVHSGFSFSIVHLLSAVRMAMVILLPEDSSEAGKHLGKNDAEQDSKQEDTSVPSAQLNVPSLCVQEIVNRVKSNPGDPCILETQEPLQDLIRGVLKIFSSRTAPLGAKGWKPLVVYQKSAKSWTWIGPVPHNPSESEVVEEMTSPDAWGLPHKMLVKLVDSFANWLKNSQETLQQIGSLPSPPLALMQINLDEKERFKDLRAQKSLSTIGPSPEEVKDYFRKEEVLRYLIPDRVFSYTAVDGKKSIVAPLRRCGGKPTSKARDHFMLKRNRPPHVTILCLVRDAAARLPGSIGTRADVCTLIRDSQYVVEDVSDAQVNQVVSGALDRLHYERDPCVQFDGERKLWVYLHREREEEDFEDDGTSSTKKGRRQKKESEPSETGDVTVAHPAGSVGRSGFDLVSDLNVEALGADNNDKRSEHEYRMEDNAETSHDSDQYSTHPGSAPVLKMSEENKFCRDNSANEDFDDAFDGEPPT